MHAALIYPHQLHREHPALSGVDVCVLVEEPLLLTQSLTQFGRTA